MPNISADGNWVGIILVMVCLLVGIWGGFSLRKPSPSRKANRNETPNDPEVQRPERPDRREQEPSHGHGAGHGHHGGERFSFLKMTPLRLVGWILALCFAYWFFFRGGGPLIIGLLFAGVVSLAGSAATSIVPSPNLVLHPQTHSSSIEALRKIDADTQKKIESESHSTTFTYLKYSKWIRNPPGYYAKYTTDDDKSIVLFCSAHEEMPAMNADGPEYTCLMGPDGKLMGTANWWRPAATSADEGRVTVRYKFVRFKLKLPTQ